MVDVKTKRFVQELKNYVDELPRKTIKTIRGQALSGDLEGAVRGLKRCLSRRADGCDGTE